jgi:uncharacterized protein (DUF2267 family)
VRYWELIRRVGERAGVDDRFEAERTTVAVLQALCDRLPGKEANDLLAQLPSLLRDAIVVSPAPLPLSADGMVQRVARELDVAPDEAAARIRAVFATLREAVTVGELRDVIEQLDPDYADLLA